MTLSIRNQENQYIVDIEIYEKNEDNNKFIDISSSINIETYSNLLLNENENTQELLIKDFQFLSEIRGWYWEVYLTNNDIPVLIELKIEIVDMINKIIEKYNLHLIED